MTQNPITTAGFQLDKSDEYIFLGAVILVSLVFFIFTLIKTKGFNMEALEDLAALANSKGGLVIIMLFMWFTTLGCTATFCIWILIKKIDPENAVVITMLGMLISNAFGTVNGALFKTMTGEEVKRNGNGNGITPVNPTQTNGGVK